MLTTNHSLSLKRLLQLTSTLVSIFVLLATSTGIAMSREQKRAIDSGARYFNIEQTAICDSSATLLSGAENTEKTWNYLIGKGLTPPQAAGMMGNIHYESAETWDPRIVEFAYSDPPHRSDHVPPNLNEKGQPGYGLVQWTSPGRKQGLANLAAERGVIAGDLGVQLDYLWQELTTTYKTSTLDPIMATDSYEESTDIFLEEFERPADIEGTRPTRRKQALDILEKYGSNSDITPASKSTSCGSTATTLNAEGCPTEPIPESETVRVSGITVHPCIAEEVDRVVKLANSQGLNMSGGGWRDSQNQIRLRRQNCGTSDYAIYDMPSGECTPPTAKPGASNHERGSAVDFTCDGVAFTSRSHPCFVFLQENTSLINYPEEAWHWSIDGG